MKYWQCIGLRDDFGKLKKGYPKFVEAIGAEQFIHSQCPDVPMYIFDTEEPEFEGDAEVLKESRICHAESGYCIARGLTRDDAIKRFEQIVAKHGAAEITRRAVEAISKTGRAPV